jgi:ComF family protein
MWKLLDPVLDWIYPPKCALCREIGAPSPCPQCISQMRAAVNPPTHLVESRIREIRAVYDYESPAGEAVRRLKYSRSRSLVPFMSRAIRIGFDAWNGDWDKIVPLPIHWSRQAERGFNQAEMLCRGLDPATVDLKLLKRARLTPPQASLNAENRRVAPVGAFQACRSCEGLRILIVDDVVTTGSTLKSAADALFEAGAARVDALSFAVSPFGKDQ